MVDFEKISILTWYGQFLNEIRELGLNPDNPNDLLRVKCYRKPDNVLEEPEQGEIFYPFAGMSAAPDDEECDKYADMGREYLKLRLSMIELGVKLKDARMDQHPDEEILALQDEYKKAIAVVKESAEPFVKYHTEIFADFFERLAASATLPDAENPDDFPVIEEIYNCSKERLLTVDIDDTSNANYRLIITDEDDMIMVSEVGYKMTKDDPFILDLATIDNIRQFAYAHIEGRYYDENYCKERNEFARTVSTFKEYCIRDGKFSRELVTQTLLQQMFNEMDTEYQNTLSDIANYFRDRKIPDAPKGMEDRYAVVIKRLHLDAVKLNSMKKTIDTAAERLDTMTTIEKYEYDLGMETYEKAKLKYDATKGLIWTLGKTIKNSTGEDSGIYALDEVDTIQKNMAVLSRVITHRLHGSYNLVKIEQIRQEADALYDYPVFRTIINTTITQEKLMGIIEGPGMREFDKALRTAVVQNAARRRA